MSRGGFQSVERLSHKDHEFTFLFFLLPCILLYVEGLDSNSCPGVEWEFPACVVFSG